MIIRRVPEDFVVEEVLRDGVLVPCGSGGDHGTLPLADASDPRHCVFTLWKTSLTTPQATAGLARALGVRSGLVQYAGMKDKHAVTCQHVSVAMAALRQIPPASATLVGDGWKAHLVGISERALGAGDIASNRFELVIRQCTREDLGTVRARVDTLALNAEARASTGDGSVLLFANFYGEQRFGSARHAEGFAGERLAHGDFEGALRLLIATPARKDTGARRTFTRMLASRWGQWQDLATQLPKCPERACVEALARGQDWKAAFAELPAMTQTFAVDAFQSFLWNRALHAWVRGLGVPVVGTETAYGPLATPMASAVSRDTASSCMPLPSPALEATGSDHGTLATLRVVLREQGIAPAQLCVPGLRRPRYAQGERACFARARDFAIDGPLRDDMAAGPGRSKLRLRFSLPSGSYATVLLRLLGQT